MNTDTMGKVFILAERARRRVELIAEEENFPYSLGGLCARASAILFNLLNEAGFKSYICFGWHHCFLELNEYIIDITASQFGYNRIVIANKNDFVEVMEVNRINWWQHDGYKFDNLKQAILYQIEHSWPREQKINSADFL